MEAEPVEIGVYRRSLTVGVDRVWENVLDWEHLPWLHHSSFSAVELDEAGPWGWRAQAVLRGADAAIGLELRIDREASRYVTRTLTGPGAGSEIWTRVEPVGADRTDIEVGFRVPVEPENRDAVGAAYIALYTRLWDEDEAMMRERDLQLGERGVVAATPVALGSAESLRARVPCTVEFHGRKVHVVASGDAFVAYDARCPHWLGPLDAQPSGDSCVACPWHGYRFDVETGKGKGVAASLRLRHIPVVVDAAGGVSLGV